MSSEAVTIVALLAAGMIISLLVQILFVLHDIEAAL